MTAAVIGVIVMPIPRPIIMKMGKINENGVLKPTRLRSSRPPPARSGPTVIGSREPNFDAYRPASGAATTIIPVKGRNRRPAAKGP